MKILAIIGIAVAIIVLIPLTVALFVKNDYSVARSIRINQPKDQVFDYIKYLKNQDNFSKWAKLDPNMEKSYTGTDGTVGFISSWSSDHQDVGKGEQEIKKIVDGERIDFELRFLKPFKSVSKAHMAVTSISQNETTVEWGFTGRMSYPMNLLLLFMNFEKMIGSDFDEGLENLKKILES